MSIIYLGTSSNNSYYYNNQFEIAHGSYGSVYYGLKKPLSPPDKAQLIAVKIFERDNRKEEISVEAEIKALLSIKHPSVVEVFDVIKTSINSKKKVFLMLELCNRGNIEDFVKNNELSELEIRYLFREIAKGLQYIQKDKDFIHRDIKANNILLNENILKIADFGEARQLKLEEEAGSYKGTPLYMNPQMLNGKNYTKKGDIFSLGVLLYFMYYKKTPWFINSLKERYYEHPPKLLQKYLDIVDNGCFNDIFERFPEVFISESAKNLIKNMIQIEEEDRYDIEQVMEHPYMKFEKNGIFSPKITRIFEFSEMTGLGKEEKIMKKLMIEEVKKQRIRKISERIYYERDKVLFIHNCMKKCYDLNEIWENSQNWQGILLVLTRLSEYKSRFLYNFLKEKKTHLYYSEADWQLFYEKGEIYEKSLEIMMNCYKITEKNLKNFKEKIGIFTDFSNENISFFEDLQQTILKGFQLMGNYKENDHLVIVLYNLMIIVTTNGSMDYSSERGIVNYEKFHEDQIHKRSIRIMKMRLESFYKLLDKSYKKVIN